MTKSVKLCKCARCGRAIKKGKELYNTGLFYGPVCYKLQKNKVDEEEYASQEISAPVAFIAPAITLDEDQATDQVVAQYIHQDIRVNISRNGHIFKTYGCTEIEKLYHRVA